MATSISRRAEAIPSITIARPTLRTAAFATAALVLVVGVVSLVSRSSLMHVRRIEVSGTEHLSVAEVIHESGVGQETNALWLDTAGVEAALELDPWISRARVERVLPWAVRISVAERAPVASILTSGGYELIAADGTSLGTTLTDPGLPRIIGTAMLKDQTSPPTWQSAALVIRALDANFRSTVKDVGVDAGGAVQIHLQGGIEVNLGEPTDMATKVEALTAVLKWTKEQHFQVRAIDVSAPAVPAVRFAA